MYICEHNPNSLQFSSLMTYGIYTTQRTVGSLRQKYKRLSENWAFNTHLFYNGILLNLGVTKTYIQIHVYSHKPNT